jgi:hypothetical protein
MVRERKSRRELSHSGWYTLYIRHIYYIAAWFHDQNCCGRYATCNGQSNACQGAIILRAKLVGSSVANCIEFLMSREKPALLDASFPS